MSKVVDALVSIGSWINNLLASHKKALSPYGTVLDLRSERLIDKQKRVLKTGSHEVH